MKIALIALIVLVIVVIVWYLVRGKSCTVSGTDCASGYTCKASTSSGTTGYCKKSA